MKKEDVCEEQKLHDPEYITQGQLDNLKKTMTDENEPKKFIVEFTTKTHPNVVKQDFEKIKKFIEENVGNITKEITMEG